jgi:virulence-associated protein VapD
MVATRIFEDTAETRADLGLARAHSLQVSALAKVLARILAAQADANIRFIDVRNLLRRLGFSERIRGSHYIFTRDEVDEIINLQPIAGKAKPYQVRQVRALIRKYELSL